MFLLASSENYTIVGKPSGSISSSTTTTAAQLPAGRNIKRTLIHDF